jgi:KDO2-lipid IV(A) lauroyltransferase
LASKKSGIQIRTEYAVARLLLVVLRWVPGFLAERVARLFAGVLDLAVPKLRRVALINLKIAFPHATPEEQDRIVDGVFASIGRLLLAIARFPSLDSVNVHSLIRYEGLENYQQAKAEGKGVLVATGHLGNWELSAYAHALMTEPMNVLVRPLDNPLIDELLESRRAGSGNRLITKKEAARRVLRALSANEAVGILMDQNTSGPEGVFIRFFGRAVSANSAFVKLAHHSGAAVVPGFALWEPGTRQYVLRFYPKIPMSGDVVEDTQRIHDVLERIIREHPDQWMWIHRRWKTRPPGEAAIY